MLGEQSKNKELKAAEGQKEMEKAEIKADFKVEGEYNLTVEDILRKSVT